MKQYFNCMLYACTVLVLSTSFSSCIKDKGIKRTVMYVPVYETSQEVRDEIKSDAAIPISYTGKMVILGNFIYLNEPGQGVHIIDNTNPASPVNKAFIHIPGNEDIAVKGSILYADCFTDLMAIDITDPTHVSLKNYVANMFPDRQWVQGMQLQQGQIISKWIPRDTVLDITVSEGNGIWRDGNYYSNIPIYFANPQLLSLSNIPATVANKNTSGTTGVTGSMSRFAIINNFMYTVTNNNLNTVDVTTAADPKFVNTISFTDWHIETIYPFQDKLFIGSNSTVYIYDVTNPGQPNQVGTFGHVHSCDPVIADEHNAYFTLHSGNLCGEVLNELEVLNIDNITNPVLIKDYPLTSPYGLFKDENTLFICDNVDGLKVFDATDPANVHETSTIPLQAAFDVICINKIAIVIAGDGLYQFDYSDLHNIKQLSKISLQQ